MRPSDVDADVDRLLSQICHHDLRPRSGGRHVDLAEPIRIRIRIDDPGDLEESRDVVEDREEDRTRHANLDTPVRANS